MVNYHDPQTVARDFMALVNLHHVFTGIFIWEFFTTLDYEWDIIRGRRPYRWSIWIYTLARVATLSGLATELTGFDITTRINCQVWGVFGIALPNTAFAAASLLIVLRIVAIWNRDKIIILIAVAIWVTDVAFLINGCVRIRDSWSYDSNSCILLNPQNIKPNIMSSLIADVLLLVIMLVGLLRIRFGSGNTFGLERVLWKQGVIWLLFAIVCEIPPTVFVCLDLNEPLSFIFQALNLITITIAATRMYRSLMIMGSAEILQESVRDSGRTISKSRVQPEPIPLSRMESVRVEMDRPSKSQMAGSSSYISTDPHVHYKEHEVSHNVDVNSGSEK
ncbi:hypothetical protein BGY98DRAFT_93753 [Russula aff. rugulosa BPL654]|nr:hypothetical protein BGY98DRAFT_93753 [Russula aff. rugulosa BPL654]